MSTARSQLHVLLPALARDESCAELRHMRVRGDRLADAPPGYLPALTQLFQWPGQSLPSAALTREAACADAGTSVWLSADPAYAQADINGARLMACGQLDMDADEAQALARSLRPLLGDNGMLLELTTPARWHLRLADGAKPPLFDSVEQVLGEDLLTHLPSGDIGLRWRKLFTDVQVILHQHPVNSARRQCGQAPVNSLWFWGGGQLPAWVKSRVMRVFSADPLTQALAARAGLLSQPATLALLAGFDGNGATLLDVDNSEALPAWSAALETWQRRHRGCELFLYFSDGTRYRFVARHRWRCWRRLAK
ncbi:MAG: phosphoglycerate mutase [Xanthomonadales bacterium]|nr:phosphoglycerate mutase [Xanthomonadales bacterium]